MVLFNIKFYIMKTKLFSIAVLALFVCFTVNAQSSLVAQERTQLVEGDKKEISADQLPAPIKEALKSDTYKGWTIVKAFHVSGTAEHYEVVVKNDTSETSIKFDAQGNAIQ
jgi:hypothetical protein